MNKSYYIKGRKHYKGKCDFCGKEYDGIGKKYCSHRCSTTASWKNGSIRSNIGLVGSKSLHWRGGRAIRNGYVFVYVGSGKYLGEHRIVMEKNLGRKLTQNEQIHHINGIKTDNRLENLQIVVKKVHYGKVECPMCHYKFLIK